MANKLNAPRIDTKLPAQTSNAIKIPYLLPNSVSFSDFKKIRVLIKNVLSGDEVKRFEINDEGKEIENPLISVNYRQKNEHFSNYYNLIINESNPMEVGESYKIQIAFMTDDETIGYYSNAGITKCVEAPEVSFTGNYSGGPCIVYGVAQTGGDRIISYSWKLYHKNRLAETTDTIYDTTNTRYYWTPDFTSYENSEEVRVEFCYSTLNNFEDNITTTFVYSQGESNVVNRVGLTALYDETKAQIEVWVGYISKTLTNCALYRYSDKANAWLKIGDLDFTNQESGTVFPCFYDNTVEHGVSYKYAIAKNGQYFEDMTELVKVDFEHIYLSDEEKQICIKFNPSVSSFKNIIQEQKVETIGGSYPYFFRNGNIKYRELPLSGLISYLMNEEDNISIVPSNLFDLVQRKTVQGDVDQNGEITIADLSLVREALAGTKKISIYYDINRDDFVTEADTAYLLDILSGLAPSQKSDRTSTPAQNAIVNSRTTQLTADNIAKEKDFKIEVEAWLQNGKPKLFRSATEGNFIVRLMNVSLSPNAQLGRMLHTFSATGYEIAEFSTKELRKHNFFCLNKNIAEPDIKNIKIVQGDSWDWYCETKDVSYNEYVWPKGWTTGKNVNKEVRVGDAPFSLNNCWIGTATDIPDIPHPHALFRKALYIPYITELKGVKIGVRYDEDIIIKFNNTQVFEDANYHDQGFKVITFTFDETTQNYYGLNDGVNWISAHIDNANGGMGFDMYLTPIYK